MFAQKSTENMFEYWISFWPVAPFFGVKWRFESMMPASEVFKPGEVASDMMRAAAAEAATAAEESAAEARRAAAELETAPAAAAEPVQDFAEASAEAVEVLAEPVAEAATLEAPAALYADAPAEIDDLKAIKGVGPKLEATLNELGVYRYDQIAGFSENDLAWIDEQLPNGPSKGKAFRDDWIAQAKSLL